MVGFALQETGETSDQNPSYPLRQRAGRFSAGLAGMLAGALSRSRSVASPRSVRPVLGWLTDTFRLGWGALFWNARKSWHIARGRRGRCPCQVPSDSGRAMETGCDAASDYHSPARFRVVCPLLARGADGSWVCSANAGDVRPFWGRALGLLGAGAALALLILSLALFGLLRGIGYEVRYTQIVWPPAWREFRQMQSAFYLDRAREAQSHGRVAESLLHLSNAYELNPRDHRAGLLLAQLRQTGQPLLSDQTYARLFADHPDHRAEIAQAWYRALLARGDFGSAQRIAGERLLNSGPAPGAAWLQAFLFATRQLGESSAISHLLANAKLPSNLAPLLRAEQTLYTAPADARVELLARLAAEATDAFASYHWPRRLLEEGRGDLVLPIASRREGPLGDREKARLRLDALATLGRDAERASLVRQLLAQPTHPAICELLSSHLIAHPAPDLLAAYADKLEREPIPAGDAVYPQLLAFFAACGVHRDVELTARAATWVNAAAGRDFRALAAVRDALLNPSPAVRLQNFLPVLQPLPLEVTYALYAHYSPPPRFAP